MKVAELTFVEFLNSKATWDDALRRSWDNHDFLTWEWLSEWWKHFGDQREFHLVTVTDGGRILAAAPLMSSIYKMLAMKLRKIEFIATPASDYHTFLLTEKNPKHARMMIEYAFHEIPGWDYIELGEVPENSETAKILATLDRRLGFKCRIQNACPYLPLPKRFEDFSENLSKHFRHNLGRYERKLRKEHLVNFKICSKAAEISDYMGIFFDLHRKRWQSKKKPGALAARKTRDFHLGVAESFAEKGWLTLSSLALEDVPVASIYGFDYQQKLYFYLSGFDPAYSKYNVGDLQQLFLIKHCIGNGLKEFDFMRGDEPYKERWNTTVRRNLEFWVGAKGIVPFFYGTISKSRRFSSLLSAVGRHVSIR